MEINNLDINKAEVADKDRDYHEKKGYKKDYDIKDYFETKEKMELILNMKDDDKKKLIALNAWALRATELTVVERNWTYTPIRAEIWSIDLGVNVGSEMGDVRPCIIVSYQEYNNNSGLVTVLPITKAKFNYGTQFEIDETVLESIEGTLTGTVKAEQITTKSKARLGRKIGSLNEKGKNLLNKIMLIHLGMPELVQYIDDVQYTIK